jgi:hypothetical protein
MVSCFIALDALLMEKYMEHLAVVHHAARYEVDSWGNSSFHWNDDSAQTPFMDTSFVSKK